MSVVPNDTLPETCIQAASIEDHCMSNALFHYVQVKVYPELSTTSWKTIVVRGSYRRSPPAQPMNNEKRDKPFNWHRPTLTFEADNSISLNCFPGRDYVEHYAGIIRTYLSLTGNPFSTLQLEYPSVHAAKQIFLDSNLRDMGQIDVVVVGYVWQLQLLVNIPWEGQGEDSIFAWRKAVSASGRTIALLGCMPSFWGDISRSLVEALHELNQVQCILYIGKAGSLRSTDTPNQVIATGSSSNIHDEVVRWDNALEKEICLSPKIQAGHHVTTSTPICESKKWYAAWQARARWVDCEVGHMAKACNKASVSFGYLHIISDNLTAPDPYNMSNERLASVKADRRTLLQDVSYIIQAFCSKPR